MKWSFSNDAPIYAQLIEQIKIGIVTGEFAAGTRLLSVRDLAGDAGVNPNTMQRALAQLETEELVRSHRTAGRFVTEDRERIDALRRQLARKHAQAFLQAMQSLGISPAQAAELLTQMEEEEDEDK